MTDIYCDIIDNYGDMAFAVKVMNTLSSQKTENSFRFFGNNLEVYELFQRNLLSNIQGVYYDISKIETLTPSKSILNLFERKIDYSFLESFEFPIYLKNFSYFSLEPYTSPLSPGIQAFHGKISVSKNLSVENIGVSLLPKTGGVFSEKHYLPEILSKRYFTETYEIPETKKWISVFCYPETLKLLQEQDFFEAKPDIIFLTFPKHDINGDNIYSLPFLSMQEYYSLLQNCHANIVRGENSLIPALESSAPFFWDIYKEDNNAHIAKIQDFAGYLRTQGYSEQFIQAQADGNIKREYGGVKNVLY